MREYNSLQEYQDLGKVSMATRSHLKILKFC